MLFSIFLRKLSLYSTMLLLFVTKLIVAPSTNGDAKPEITEQDQQVQEGKLMYFRVVIKVSSCRVNTTSRREIKRLGISFGSIFLLFSNKSSRGPLL